MAAMLADAELPEDVVPRRVAGTLPPKDSATRATASKERPSPRQVLLTGATGFVGAHLLHQLLRQTDARMVCLVRAQDEAQAMERLRAPWWRSSSPRRDSQSACWRCPADLTQPAWDWAPRGSTGWPPSATPSPQRRRRQRRARVRQPPGGQRPRNARAAAAGRRRASQALALRLHAGGGAPGEPQPRGPRGLRAPAPGPARRLPAEQVGGGAAASSRRLGARPAVSVYRLGRVVGRAGHRPRQHAGPGLAHPARGTPRGRPAPARRGRDLDAGGLRGAGLVAALAGSRGPARCSTSRPRPRCGSPSCSRWVRDYGYPVELCPVPEWRARVARAPGTADNRTTLAFFDLRAGSARARLRPGPHPLRAGAVQALAGSGISCPPTDRAAPPPLPGLLRRRRGSCPPLPRLT